MIARLRALRYSLRARLFFATVILAAAALTMSSVMFERAAHRVILDAIRSHLTARAREALETIVRFQRERAMTVYNWAEAEGMQLSLDTKDPKFAEDYLRRTVQDQGGTIAAAALLDARGSVVAAVRALDSTERRAAPLLEMRGRRIDAEPARAALEGRRPASVTGELSAIDFREPSKALGLLLASPVKDFTGEVVGAVVASVSPAAMQRLLADINGGSSKYVPIVFDSSKVLVISLPGVEARGYQAFLGGAPALELERQEAAGTPALGVRTDEAEGAPGWTAVMVVPEHVAYGPMRALRFALSLVLVSVLSLASVAAVWALRRAARPLTTISTSMEKVAGGDLSTRLPEAYAGELGQVARSFNSMVGEVERSRQELARTESMRREMQIAHTIQTSILPKVVALPGFDFAARMKPADDVGGDFYDLRTCRDDQFWVLVGDVSGHGIQSGLVMLMAQAAAVTQIERDPTCSPKAVITAVNQVLYQNVKLRMGRDDYLTFMAARHVGDGRFVAAGGHQPIFITRAVGGVEMVDAVGPWCGIMADVGQALSEYEYHLGPGDQMCLITDGIVEAPGQGGMFGEDRLRTVLSSPAESADEVLKRVFTAAEKYMERQDDDMTAVIIKREVRGV